METGQYTREGQEVQAIGGETQHNIFSFIFTTRIP